MRELHDADAVAYVRFASVYRSFKDLNEFMAELEDLLNQRTNRARVQVAAQARRKSARTDGPATPAPSGSGSG